MLNKKNEIKESIGTPEKRETLDRCTQPGKHALVCTGIRGQENGMIPAESRISKIEMQVSRRIRFNTHAATSSISHFRLELEFNWVVTENRLTARLNVHIYIWNYF